MKQLGDTKHVRIATAVYNEMLALSKETQLSAAEIATWCISDCLSAYKTKKPIVPRIVKIMQVIEDGPEFHETVTS
jgi:hypothetical protein